VNQESKEDEEIEQQQQEDLMGSALLSRGENEE
jgi:hypothetical protein